MTARRSRILPIIRSPAAAWVVTGLLLAIVAFVLGRSGRLGEWSGGPTDRFVVVGGDSMAPTACGPATRLECPACRLRWLVSARQSGHPKARRICFHCGANLNDIEPVPVRPDRIRIKTTSNPIPGDIVLVDVRGRRRLKRLVAIGGQTIDFDSSSLELTVDGQPIARRLRDAGVDLPWFLVDDDRRRSVSRWLTGSDRWRTYHHLGVHDHGVASPITDDYPFNVAVSRRLFEVGQFRLTADAETDAEVLFWTPSGLGRLRTRPGPIDVQSADAIVGQGGARPDDPVLSPSVPAAIRPLAANTSVTSIRLYRSIVYRLRPSDDRGSYPLRLRPRQAFVLGDNVPVSVDGRDFGPVAIDDLVECTHAR